MWTHLSQFTEIFEATRVAPCLMALEYQSPHPENKSSTQNRVQRSSLLEYDVSTTILWSKLFLEEQGYLFSMKEIFFN
jgi:hypothetical protein